MNLLKVGGAVALLVTGLAIGHQVASAGEGKTAEKPAAEKKVEKTKAEQKAKKGEGKKPQPKPSAAPKQQKAPHWDDLNENNRLHPDGRDTPEIKDKRPRAVKGKFLTATNYAPKVDDEVVVHHKSFFKLGAKAPKGESMDFKVYALDPAAKLQVVRSDSDTTTIKFKAPSTDKPAMKGHTFTGWTVGVQAVSKNSGKSKVWWLIFKVSAKPEKKETAEEKAKRLARENAKKGSGEKPKPKPGQAKKKPAPKAKPKPTAQLTVNGKPVTAGQEFVLDARATKFIGGIKAKTYTFKFRDIERSSTSPICTITATAKMAGTHEASVVVTADNGESSKAVQNVHVNLPPKLQFTLAAGPDDGDLIIDATATKDETKLEKLKFSFQAAGHFPQALGGGKDTFGGLTPGQKYTITVTVVDTEGGKTALTQSITLPEAKTPQPRGVNASSNKLSSLDNMPVVKDYSD